MKILLLSVALLSAVYAKYPKPCEPIKVSTCQEIGYNHTSLPNFAHQTNQDEAERSLRALEPLLTMRCAPYLRLFVCTVYVPMCAGDLSAGRGVGPCQGLCERTRYRCASLLMTLGIPWPKELECSNFYHENDFDQVCITGPA